MQSTTVLLLALGVLGVLSSASFIAPPEFEKTKDLPSELNHVDKVQFTTKSSDLSSTNATMADSATPKDLRPLPIYIIVKKRSTSNYSSDDENIKKDVKIASLGKKDFTSSTENMTHPSTNNPVVNPGEHLDISVLTKNASSLNNIDRTSPSIKDNFQFENQDGLNAPDRQIEDSFELMPFDSHDNLEWYSKASNEVVNHPLFINSNTSILPNKTQTSKLQGRFQRSLPNAINNTTVDVVTNLHQANNSLLPSNDTKAEENSRTEDLLALSYSGLESGISKRSAKVSNITSVNISNNDLKEGRDYDPIVYDYQIPDEAFLDSFYVEDGIENHNVMEKKYTENNDNITGSTEKLTGTHFNSSIVKRSANNSSNESNLIENDSEYQSPKVEMLILPHPGFSQFDYLIGFETLNNTDLKSDLNFTTNTTELFTTQTQLPTNRNKRSLNDSHNDVAISTENNNVYASDISTSATTEVDMVEQVPVADDNSPIIYYLVNYLGMNPMRIF